MAVPLIKTFFLYFMFWLALYSIAVPIAYNVYNFNSATNMSALTNFLNFPCEVFGIAKQKGK